MGVKVNMMNGDVLSSLRSIPDESVHCVVTSPPYYGLRDYNADGQIGLEKTPGEYVDRLVEVFREVRRVLREDGTLWLNLGDTYATQGGAHGSRGDNQRGVGAKRAHNSGGADKNARRAPSGLKPKDLIGIPWRVAFALQQDGWWLRQDIIWHKPNPMPESVRDRCTKAHEYVFLLAKSDRYYYDAEAVSEAATGRPPGTTKPTKADRAEDDKHRTAANLHEIGARETRNRRSVWHVATRPYKGAHFAVMPAALAETCVMAGCPETCCGKCGAGYVRVVERKRTPTRPGRDTKATGDKMIDGNRDPQRHVTKTMTVGWRPSCKCGEYKTRPGVVLDPFSGSGTTLAVAVSLGRDSVGIELNQDYVALAQKRIAEARSKSHGPWLFGSVPFHGGSSDEMDRFRSVDRGVVGC